MNRFNFTVQTDKMAGGWHGSYTPFYERLFAGIKDHLGFVLEIGTDGGGSLLAYRNWFKYCTVIGMDINPAPEAVQGQQRVVHIQEDAYNTNSVKKLKDYHFTAMIDDGPHTLESQLFFVEFYVPLLSEDGIAVVEDVQDIEHISKLAGKLPPGFMGYGVDLRWADDRYDSILFVAQRK